MYPGNAVGIDGPVGTVRLVWLREGFEDLEYLACTTGSPPHWQRVGVCRNPSVDLVPTTTSCMTGWRRTGRSGLVPRASRQVGAEVAQLFGPTPALVRIDKPTAGHVVVELITLKDAAVRIAGKASTPVSSQGPSATHRVVLNLPAGEQTIAIAVADSNFSRTVKVAPSQPRTRSSSTPSSPRRMSRDSSPRRQRLVQRSAPDDRQAHRQAGLQRERCRPALVGRLPVHAAGRASRAVDRPQRLVGSRCGRLRRLQRLRRPDRHVLRLPRPSAWTTAIRSIWRPTSSGRSSYR